MLQIPIIVLSDSYIVKVIKILIEISLFPVGGPDGTRFYLKSDSELITNVEILKITHYDLKYA